MPNYTKCPSCHRTNGEMFVYNYAASGSSFRLKVIRQGEHAYEEITFKPGDPKLKELHEVIGRFLAGVYKGS